MTMNTAVSKRELEGLVQRALGSSTETASVPIAAWISLVEAWNRKIDLTAARGRDELVDILVADAAVLAKHVASGARVVDVGSGAGAPGLPLALLRDDLDVTLIEPMQKRVAFLRTALGSLEAGVVSRVRVTRARGEDLRRGGQRFDVAVARAVLAPRDWLALGAALAEEVWVLLAREEPPEHAFVRILDDIEYRWPLTGAARRAVRYRAQSHP
jgi:16S rRNA (guanine527-N7)-methyltransferase